MKLLLAHALFELMEVCLKPTCFYWKGQYYEQLQGVAMRSPLTTVVANICVQQFEKVALESVKFKL